MSLELWSTLASIGTFVVIATTAIAALVQLRHMRSSNQITLLTEVRETLESDRFAQARRYILEELPKLIDDPAGREKLSAPPPMPLELESVRMLANFLKLSAPLSGTGSSIKPSYAICMVPLCSIHGSNSDRRLRYVAQRRIVGKLRIFGGALSGLPEQTSGGLVPSWRASNAVWRKDAQ